MYNRNRFYELISAFQKSIRWCEINDSRYFARQLVEMGYPGAVFNRLMIIAAEDVGLADPTLVEYESNCLEYFEALIKQYAIKKKEAISFPDICEIVDRAVIAAAISYKSRLLPMLSFASLYDIYKNENFKKNLHEYFHLFVNSMELEDEKQALYYAFIVGIFWDEMPRILRVIQEKSESRNANLIKRWVEEYGRKEERLMLAGSIVLLCRELNYNHGEYKNNINKYLSIPIKAAEIPDRAYDQHTSVGKKRGRGLEHFFNEGATVNNERFQNDWEMAGRNAYYLADSQGLGKASKVIEATKAKLREPDNLVTI